MPLNTITVSGAVAPTVIETYISHYINRKDLHRKPTAHVSYHEGLHLIRSFLLYASHHTVEELQAFTSQWVPTPQWVRTEDAVIPQKQITEAAEAIQRQLGPQGIDRVGGREWWQWRRQRSTLKAEWIEMRNDYVQRKKFGDPGKRVMLYVHGGAYFFGSVDEHRYQMQRHARKLKARLTTTIARYRLAPQFPFPCGLHDCVSAYLYLLTVQDPSTIILAGDSAGGGMIVSLMVILRDQGLPLPAGAILISPWVDLTHSFPSVTGDSSLDYIPAHGFLNRPSPAWPPPTNEELQAAMRTTEAKRQNQPNPSSHGSSNATTNGVKEHPAAVATTISTPGRNLSITLNGKLVEITEQIQMYASNELLSHPLVSPVLQPSLGGLPPILVQTGGGEMLRDEQIYLAHKAANPGLYPPGKQHLDLDPNSRDILSKWEGTDVQLQVWEDCCHVTPTLSFTRPAKFMYRSIAQFGAWALARAQKTEIDILDDDDISIISPDSDSDSTSEKPPTKPSSDGTDGTAGGAAKVGKAGDPLPSFHNHMIRQRVDRHGVIYPHAPATSLPALQLPPEQVGVIKPGPVRKWLAAKKEWDRKYAREKRQVQKTRARELAEGYQLFPHGDMPPPSALAGRRHKDMPQEAKKSRSWGMSLWSLWGSKHDVMTIEREEKADREPEVTVVGATRSATGSGAKPRAFDGKPASRSRSRRRTVTDQGQASRPFIREELDENSTVSEILAKKDGETDAQLLEASMLPEAQRGGPHTASERPVAGNVAYPFKLAVPEGVEPNASMLTLTSAAGALTPRRGGSVAMSTVTGGDEGRGDETKNVEDEAREGVAVDTKEDERGRPEPERFVTAEEDVPTVSESR